VRTKVKVEGQPTYTRCTRYELDVFALIRMLRREGTRLYAFVLEYKREFADLLAIPKTHDSTSSISNVQFSSFVSDFYMTNQNMDDSWVISSPI